MGFAVTDNGDLVVVNRSRLVAHFAVAPGVVEIGNDKRRDLVINIGWPTSDVNIVKLRQAFTREMTPPGA
jgi:hypothetical protein